MARVRRLNFSEQTGGTNLTPAVIPATGAWDLETDLEPRFIKRAPVHLLAMSVVVPQPKALVRGWSVLIDHRFIGRRAAAFMPFTSFHPHVPYVLVDTNSATLAGSAVLHFAAVPPGVKPLMVVLNVSDGSVIPAGTTVVSVVGTTVNLSVAVTGAGVLIGQTIRFSY